MLLERMKMLAGMPDQKILLEGKLDDYVMEVLKKLNLLKIDNVDFITNLIIAHSAECIFNSDNYEEGNSSITAHKTSDSLDIAYEIAQEIAQEIGNHSADTPVYRKYLRLCKTHKL